MKRAVKCMTTEIKIFGPWSYEGDNSETTPTVAHPRKIDVGQHQVIKTEIESRIMVKTSK